MAVQALESQVGVPSVAGGGGALEYRMNPKFQYEMEIHRKSLCKE